MSEAAKRKFRQSMQSGNTRPTNIATRIFMLTLFIFLAVQLVINAILSPMGVQLEAYNVEKTRLLEENRSLEQTLANMGSIKALNHLSAKKLKLVQSNTKQIVYISDSSLRAEK
ncbi:MAG: hypothetical protein UT34_C0001G0206 [candidate division WS6 bacterium GW2011_GWF2_39_15]|uniref:Cell division protein FtsL n=1 Tax=candidate division WS6 bacterium GW2011_GWF2_39_15 TaxID=1619100 RepID=A0A0G0N035_9BACT|nr:MAG: hypothetical protein UT34_C0001G0206 [candidate division WS6 bacterium GW2011_GWF2_39_15]